MDALDDMYVQIATQKVTPVDSHTKLTMERSIASAHGGTRRHSLSYYGNNPGRLDSETLRVFSVQDKVDLTVKYLDMWTVDSLERAIVRIVDSMTAPQLSLYLEQLHDQEQVGELYADLHGLQYRQLETRLRRMLPEVTMHAAAILIREFFPDPDGELEVLFASHPALFEPLTLELRRYDQDHG